MTVVVFARTSPVNEKKGNDDVRNMLITQDDDMAKKV
jgi:hypothetical protein